MIWLLIRHFSTKQTPLKNFAPLREIKTDLEGSVGEGHDRYRRLTDKVEKTNLNALHPITRIDKP